MGICALPRWKTQLQHYTIKHSQELVQLAKHISAGKVAPAKLPPSQTQLTNKVSALPAGVLLMDTTATKRAGSIGPA